MGALLERSTPWTRRQDDLGDHEAEDDESTRDQRQPVHDAQEQQETDDRGDLDAAAERGRHRAPGAPTVSSGKRQEQRGQCRSRAHRDGGDNKPHRKRNVRIDEEDRADGDERAHSGDERERAPDR
jgi:hypothetical protein